MEWFDLEKFLVKEWFFMAVVWIIGGVLVLYN